MDGDTKRILFADMPRMQREIVIELLLDRADVETVETSARTATLCEEATGRGVDVVILGRDDPAAARALLEVSPRLVVLSVADGELIAWRYGLTPYREPLGELSPAALTAGIEPRDPLPSWWTS
jgi:hypothetical protein